MTTLLLAGSSIALVLLVAHSWRTRGRAVTLAFFISGILFGVLRGNAIWLLCRFLVPGSEGLKPYVPQEGILPQLGHESIQVAVGWVFAVYIAWTIAEMILRRVGRKGDSPPNGVKGTVPFSSRVFMLGGLGALAMLAICWCMETTAVHVGWWYWQLPTRTTLFGDVNDSAMEGWFSVVPDFLLPFLVIACSASRGRLKWLWLAVFPLHILGHMSYRWFGHAWLLYNALELGVVALAMFSPLGMARGSMREPPDRASSACFAAALAIFFGVIVAANLAAGAGAAAGIATTLPLLMMCLLAWRRVPMAAVLLVTAASLASWAWLGPRALWAASGAAALGFLRLLDLDGESLRLRLVPPVAVVVLTAWSVGLLELDRQRGERYLGAWLAGDRAAMAGRMQEAAADYARADALRPRQMIVFSDAVHFMTVSLDGDLPARVRTLQLRLPRLAGEAEALLERDPGFVPLREDLVRMYLFLGRIHDAAGQCREIHQRRPSDAVASARLGYFLLREGKLDEAERPLADALGARRPPVEAMINLGVLRWVRGRDDEARKLWEQALAKSSRDVTARMDIDMLKDSSVPRRVELRYLASGSSDREAAAWANNLAALGQGYADADRARLLEEATQFDATYSLARMSLSKLSAPGGPCPDPARSAWHARAAELAEGAK